MKSAYTPIRLLWLWMSVLAAQVGFSQVWINEILFNPPNSDAPNQYIELRGTPNLLLPKGTYLVTVEGDTSKNVGTLKNIFDLSGTRIGGNGFLVILQKTNSYTPNTNATVLVNNGSDSGFGSGSGSTINHRGDNGQTDLQKPPVTFFLIQTTNAPNFSTDIDSANNGIPNGAEYSSWAILDSIGVLGGNGFGYGAINYCKSTGATGTGTFVTTGFTPDYIGRSSNTTASGQADWVVSTGIGSNAPNWTLGSGTNTIPDSFSGTNLNHLGGPNFGAPGIPGVLLWPSETKVQVSESGTADFYTLALNTAPSGNVTIPITADTKLLVSIDGGVNYGSSKTITLANTTPKTIWVRAVDDTTVDTAYHPAWIHHSVSASADTDQYPLTTIIPDLKVRIAENDALLLNELKVNPPGTNNAPYEYVELRGTPFALLTNVYLLAIEGNASANPGTVNWAVNLSGAQIGISGLLVVGATNCSYTFPAGVTFVADSQLNAMRRALANGTVSFLLVTSPDLIFSGEDLDAGDNGILEGLPGGTSILDSVAWSDGDTNDVTYGSAKLSALPAGTPDAVCRFPDNNTPNSAAAWFYGSLLGPNGDSWVFDPTDVSGNFPFGAMLSPGAANNVSISVSALRPLSGVIGDPTNPDVLFQVGANGVNPDTLILTASSSNAGVVSNENLTIISGANGQRRLHIVPTGVGYATITITVRNGSQVGGMAFPYAASAMGRPGGVYHTGTSDASAALALDNDYFLEGDNEDQIIRLYPRNYSGGPIVGFDFKPYLDVTTQEKGEVNIEGSTRVGNRLFWIGAHSNNDATQDRTNRNRIFATDLIGTGTNISLSFAGMYRWLKTDLLNWDANNGHGKGSNYYGLVASANAGIDPKEEAGGGFNIEGLSMAPGSTTVGWIGLRAPLVPVTNRAKALIVPVLNFTTLAVSDADPGAAIFGEPIELNLGCRGIRSFEASTNGVLIVAGSPGRGVGFLPHTYKFFTWTGNPNDAAQERSADLWGMQPEGIVEVPAAPWNANTPVQIVSDNGTWVWYNDGIESKHLAIPEFRKFRSDWVPLGDIVDVPQPCIKFITLSGDTVTISWCSVPGLRYRVQYKPDLNATSVWSDITNDILATDAATSTTFSLIGGDQAFFRVTAFR